MNYALIFAGGVGQRMGASIPKQFLDVNGKPIIIHVLEKFSTYEEIAGIIVVCKEEYIAKCKEYISEFKIKNVMNVIPGGETGQLSIFQGLKFLKENTDTCEEHIVLIHDGVRPLIDHDLLKRSIDCVKKNGNSIAVSKAIETVIKIDDEGHIEETVDRSYCRNAKAPQCFWLNDIFHEHIHAQEEKRIDMIDSATLMSFYGHELFTVECKAENIKITTPNDYFMFKGMYESMIHGN